MANLSPSRIQSIAPGEQESTDDPRARKTPPPKPGAITPAASIPAIDEDLDELPKHKLDERA
jgi:hypothetical protein